MACGVDYFDFMGNVVVVELFQFMGDPKSFLSMLLCLCIELAFACKHYGS